MAERLKIVLELDDRGFVKGISRAGTQIKKFSQDADRLNTTLKRNESHLSSWSKKLRNVTVTLASLTYLVPNLTNVIFGWQRGIIDANAELERSVAIMKNFSTANSDLAAELEAKSFVDAIVEKAANAPFSLNALTDSMVKLRVSGVENTQKSFDALVDSVAAFGGTDMTLKRASVAIQQMGGKGVISMEELRQQLGEAVPNAITLMARSLNTTYSELVKQISTGNVSSGPALEAMFEEMERSLGGSAQRMMETWSGMMARFRTEAEKAARELGQAGYFDALKDQLRSLIETMQTNEFKQFMVEVGEGLAEVAKAVGDFARFLYRNLDTVKAFGVALATFVVGKQVIGSFNSLRAAIAPMIASVSSYSTALSDLTGRYRELGKQNELQAKLEQAYINRNKAKNAEIARTASLNKIQINDKKQFRKITADMLEIVKRENVEAGKRRSMLTNTTKAETRLAKQMAKRRILEKQLNTEMNISAQAFAAKRVAMLRGAVAARAYTIAIAGIKTALMTIAPLAIPIIAGMIYQWHESKNAIQENIDKLIEYRGAFATVEQLDAGKKGIEALKSRAKELGSLADKQKELNDARESYKEVENSLKNSTLRISRSARVERLEKELEEIKKIPGEIAKIEKSIEAGQQSLGASLGESLIRSLENRFSTGEAFTEAQRLYNNIRKQIADELKDGDIEEEEAVMRSTKAVIDFGRTQLSVYQDLLAERQAAVAKLNREGGSVEKIKAEQVAIEALAKKMNEISEGLKDPNSSTLGDTLITPDGAKQDSYEMIMTLSKLDTKLGSVRGKIAEITAQNNNSGTTGGMFEKFKASLGDLASDEKVVPKLELIRSEMEKLFNLETAKTQEDTFEKLSAKVDEFSLKTEDANRKARELFTKTSVDGLTLSTDASDKYKAAVKKLEAEINKAVESGDLLKTNAEQLIETLKNGGANVQLQDTVLLYSEIIKKSQQLDAQINRQSGNEESTYKAKAESMRELLNSIDKEVAGYEYLSKAVQEYINKLELMASMESGQTGVFDKWLESIGTLEENIQDFTSNTLNSLVDTMTEGLTGASASFSDFAESIIKDLVRMTIKMMLFRAISGMIGGGISVGSGAAATGATGGAGISAGGGLTSGLGVPMKQYANGGIANTPQLAMFGEGDLPEAFVPLPDGKTIPVTIKGGRTGGASEVQVNIFNQGGQRMEGESSTRFDGEKMVVDVMLKHINKPGAVRQSLKGVR